MGAGLGPLEDADPLADAADLALLRTVIPGTPRPQGSMRPVTSRSTGRAMVKPDPRTLSTRADAAAVLAAAWQRQHHRPHAGAVLVEARYVFTRPGLHWHPANTRRPVPVLREDAPRYPISSGTADVDKLCRLLGDALQLGGVLVDDALIVGWDAGKRYADEPAGRARTTVAVWPA